MKKKLKPPSRDIKRIEIVETDGEKKTIGKYDTVNKVFSCERKKSEHFMRKWNAWGLDKNVADFLAKERAIIRLKDKETKWEYECEAVDMVSESKIEEHSKHRPQYFLPIDKWEVKKIKNRSMVIECLEKDCAHNFGKQCLRGVIKLGKEGECSSYEDKLN
jgi:hypothetical protein